MHRFAGPAQLTCWAGLTPSHHESDTTVRRGGITKQGSRPVRWAAIESVKILPDTSHIGAIRDRSLIAAATATSAPWLPPEDSSSSSSTGCATTTSVPCTTHPARREQPDSAGCGSCRS